MNTTRGYFGIGIYNGKTPKNIGTLWRSAASLGASFIFTIGTRYQHQATDTTKADRHMPLFHYDDFAQFLASRPTRCRLVGVELDEMAVPAPPSYTPNGASTCLARKIPACLWVCSISVTALFSCLATTA